MAKVDYITFLDPDDEYYRNKLSSQLEVFHKSTDKVLGVITSGGIIEIGNPILSDRSQLMETF